MMLARVITKLSRYQAPISGMSSVGSIAMRSSVGSIAMRSSVGSIAMWSSVRPMAGRSTVAPIARKSTMALLLRVSGGSGLEHRRHQSTASLTPFIGTWVQESYDGYREVLAAFGVDPRTIDFLLNNQTKLKYDNGGDTLVWSLGIEGVADLQTYSITLGEYFVSSFYDGRPLNSVIFEHEGSLTEQHETIYTPTAFMKVVREIDSSGKKMICTKKVGPHFMRKIYRKQ